ncbi:MAG: hypothetical protein JO280_01615 [Mycobacteriaceae bacterium]|nr:hypothetical protein [Mycobacteriaceae bacterium]
MAQWTHRRPYHRRKLVPRRGGMLDDHEAQLRAWLDAEPALSAQAILIRLMDAVPGRFSEKQLRTVQRMVRSWRGEIARSLLRGDAAFLSPALMPT